MNWTKIQENCIGAKIKIDNLVIITGPYHVGKTEISIEFARSHKP